MVGPFVLMAGLSNWGGLHDVVCEVRPAILCTAVPNVLVQISLDKLFWIEDRCQTDRDTALPRIYELNIDL